MRILFLSNDLSGGGAEKVLVNLANGLAKHGHDITVRTIVDRGINREFLSPYVKYEYVFKKGFRGINYLHKLPHEWIYNRICYGQYDVIVPYLQGVLTKIVSYAPKSQKKIAWLHAEAGENSTLFKVSNKKNEFLQYFGVFDHIACVSKKSMDSLKNVSGINEHISVIYNTFDVNGILKNAQMIPESITRNRKTIRIVSVGKLNEDKGYLRLMSCIDRLVKQDGLDLEIMIVGEGEQRKQIEDYVNKKNLQSRVILKGFDANPYKYIARSDLFVCSSYTEGFSSVVAESLILGVPVVTTDCPGMSEMLGNNEYGIITKNSEEALYEGIKQILSSPEILTYYREKAQERSMFFSPEQTVGEVEKMFQEVIDE